MSLLLISILVLGMVGLGYAGVMMIRFLEMPGLLKMQYHYWREEMRRVLKE